MAETLSNNTKALLYTEDFSEISLVPQSKCLTLLRFDYKCQRCRNEQGVSYGSTVSAILNCTVRSTDSLKVFYERLKSNESHTITFLFNATFDDRRFLAGYDNAMTVSGYVVDIEERFDTGLNERQENEQMLLSFKLLLSGITYIGKINNKVLPISTRKLYRTN